MLFLVTWRMHVDKRHDTLALFSQMPAEQEQALRVDVTVIGRWHDLVRGTGCMIAEAPTAASISAYALKWNGYMDLDIAPVLDDEGARAVGRSMAGPG